MLEIHNDESHMVQASFIKKNLKFIHIESDKTTSIYNVSTRVLSKK